MNIPTPEWIKELLASPKPVQAPPVSVPEPANDPVDVPPKDQEEIRAAAAAMGLVEASGAELEYVDVEETTTENAELEEGAVAEEPEAEEDEQEPPEPPKEPRPPRRYEFRVRASSLKTFGVLLGDLVDEVAVHATTDGWHVLAVDPAHVAMAELWLTDFSDAFQRIRSTNVLERISEEVTFGLDLTKLKEILRLAKKDDVVYVIADLPDDQDKDRLTFEIGRTKRSMAAVDTRDLADPKIPALNLTGKLRVNVKDLVDAVKACESISDHVRLTATAEGLTVLAEGDVDKVSLDLAADIDYVRGEVVDPVTEAVERGKVSSLFPLDYLAAFIKAARAAKVDMLTVQLGTDYPIRADWATEATRGTYLCAPRIESS